MAHYNYQHWNCQFEKPLFVFAAVLQMFCEMASDFIPQRKKNYFWFGEVRLFLMLRQNVSIAQSKGQKLKNKSAQCQRQTRTAH